MDRLFAEVHVCILSFSAILIEILTSDLLVRHHTFWSRFLSCDYLARIFRAIRLCSTRCTRILYIRIKPNSHYLPRLDECFL
jgi:hypothetical protein